MDISTYMNTSMKAVIFSCSLKDGAYSTTRAWANLQEKRFKSKGVDTKVINLKEYDYEASRDIDLLHEQLTHIYDADLVIFASPTNITDMSFSCKNLLDRFVHANKKASSNGLDIFSGKMWEYASMFGCSYYTTPEGKKPVPYYDPEDISPHWRRHHGVALDTLTFMKHLGLKNVGISTWSPADPEGPSYHNMEKHKDVLKTCDEVVETFLKNKITKKLPSCSLDKFLDFFKSDDANTFGRGMTVSENELNEQTVLENIEYIKQNVSLLSHKANAFMCMKERCTKMRKYDLAEMYYVQHFEIMKNKDYRRNASSNYRPNGY
jgi:multimeric flavodoxin WrbA